MRPVRAEWSRFRTACVTGTNGKTTTTSMIEAVVAAAGEVPARVTTLGSWVAGEQLSDQASTAAFERAIGRAAELGAKVLAIETTSHALAQGFAAEWPPELAVFTNLTRDHLDYHGTPEQYLASKAQLFLNLVQGGTAVLNAADPASALLDEVTPEGRTRAAYAGRAVDPACAGLPIALAAERITAHRGGTSVVLAGPLAAALGGSLELAVVGEVHAENALAAAVATHALGYPAAAIRAGLMGFLGVPGRFQVVHRHPLVVVDYAHTPDALERTLRLARGLVRAEAGRVICVFGCGGDRDRGKRPLMGKIAGEQADEVMLTSDNPRSEAPEAIADAVAAGGVGTGARWHRELDRAIAIEKAIKIAAPNDTVIVAGKGHELVQIIGDRTVPFSDAEVARAAAASSTLRRAE